MNIFKKLFSHEALLEAVIGLSVAGLSFLVLVLLHRTFSAIEQEMIVGGCGAGAMLIFGLYRHWENSAIKSRLFLAPLAGAVLAWAAHYAFAPVQNHWTMYTFMNLVEPSLAVQNAFTLMGFAAGALTMLIMGKSFFIKPRFFFGVLGATLTMAATGYAISMRVLPWLARATWSSDVQAKASQLLMTYGISTTIFAGAFVFFFVLLHGHDKKTHSLRTK
ncbi:MAG TPA: hypothetical protein V6C81_31785 [Planktothrix sp.]|jgi:hypothetical protein